MRSLQIPAVAFHIPKKVLAVWPCGGILTCRFMSWFCLYLPAQQGPDEAAVLREEKKKKKSLQSEQQLVQLTQQLAQTEQHLNNLMTQLDPLFEQVTTLVGTQRELLNTKLKTIHHLLLQDCKPDTGVEVPEPEAGIPFPEDLQKDDQEAGNSQACEEPINWSPETWNLAPSWEVERGLRRRWPKTVTKGPAVNGGQPPKAGAVGAEAWP
ncbi:coiled-coil domain-containing protein 107 isoform X4 [Apodemus sylvaticus]|uniref:coiled-coil domain-containing protein 107 isoform X4 n=1 Tax=Apodemus sylvaticus TaxID=10129 RepID=UPI002244D911|nr:coiled-coil domain-containing protein 107 isoform X4 [Apodemus sylvaticus]